MALTNLQILVLFLVIEKFLVLTREKLSSGDK